MSEQKCPNCGDEGDLTDCAIDHFIYCANCDYRGPTLEGLEAVSVEAVQGVIERHKKRLANRKHWAVSASAALEEIEQLLKPKAYAHGPAEKKS